MVTNWILKNIDQTWSINFSIIQVMWTFGKVLNLCISQRKPILWNKGKTPYIEVFYEKMIGICKEINRSIPNHMKHELLTILPKGIDSIIDYFNLTNVGGIYSIKIHCLLSKSPMVWYNQNRIHAMGGFISWNLRKPTRISIYKLTYTFLNLNF